MDSIKRVPLNHIYVPFFIRNTLFQIFRTVPFDLKKRVHNTDVPFSIKRTLFKIFVSNVPFDLKKRVLNIYKKGTYNRELRVYF